MAAASHPRLRRWQTFNFVPAHRPSDRPSPHTRLDMALRRLLSALQSSVRNRTPTVPITAMLSFRLAARLPCVCSFTTQSRSQLRWRGAILCATCRKTCTRLDCDHQPASASPVRNRHYTQEECSIDSEAPEQGSSLCVSCFLPFLSSPSHAAENGLQPTA